MTRSLVLAALAAALALSACAPRQPDAPAPGAPPAAKGPLPKATDAKAADPAVAIFQANCTRCHRLTDVPGGPKDLSHEGATHDADWLAAHIKDPASHNPGSRMPAFGGKIGDDDIKTLATYLAGLK
jgi:mono/diheme cytochrome c family protein